MADAPAFGILVLNQISEAGLARLPAPRYRVGRDVPAPDAILVRSADLHAMAIPPSVRAIARAGAGTNNIPVAALSPSVVNIVIQQNILVGLTRLEK